MVTQTRKPLFVRISFSCIVCREGARRSRWSGASLSHLYFQGIRPAPSFSGQRSGDSLTYYYYNKIRLYPGYIFILSARIIRICFDFVFLYEYGSPMMGKHPAKEPGVCDLYICQPFIKRAWRSTVSGWIAYRAACSLSILSSRSSRASSVSMDSISAPPPKIALSI